MEPSARAKGDALIGDAAVGTNGPHEVEDGRADAAVGHPRQPAVSGFAA
jgi:hypothetical protein